MKLGQLIRLHRDTKGYSLRALGEISGVSYPQIHKLENGRARDINLSQAKALADALGLTLDEMAAAEPGEGRR